jgi:hypothetical protein
MRKLTAIARSPITSHLALQIVNILGQIAAVPLFIRNYSKSEYVLWILLNALTSFLLVADSAILQTFSVPMTQELAKTKNLNRFLLRKMIQILIKIELSSVAILCIVFYFLHIHNKDNSNTIGGKYLLFALLIFGNLLTVLQHYLLLHFQLQNIYSNGLRLITSSKIIELVFLLILAKHGTNLVAIALSSVIVRGISVTVMRRFVNRSKIRYNETRVDLRGLRNNTLGSICFTATTILANQGVLIAVGYWSVANSILLFTITRMICAPIRMVGDSIALGSFPTRMKDSLIEMESKKKAYSFYSLYGLFILAFVISIMALGSRIFHSLSNGIIVYSLAFLILMSLSVSFDGLVSLKFQSSIIEESALRIGLQYFSITVMEIALLTLCNQLHSIQAAVVLNILGDIIILILLAKRNRK